MGERENKIFGSIYGWLESKWKQRGYEVGREKITFGSIYGWVESKGNKEDFILK